MTMMSDPNATPEQIAAALVTAWKQRVFPGAQIEPPDRWLMEAVTAALQTEAARVRAEEREACAALCETLDEYTGGHGEPGSPTGRDCARAIRARGAGGG